METSYASGYTPDFPGRERFSGRIVHPQQWPDGLDYAGKRVIVIGSGATAVTLVPALAETAAHVTMLQRSPTYILSRPAHDAIAIWLRKHLPEALAYGLVRWKNILLGTLLYELSRRKPEFVKKGLLKGVRHYLGPDYDLSKHFEPRYNPWDQRLCLVPEGDLFHAIRSGRATVVTDQIETFTEKGIKLKSGEELPADIIVTATGLVLQLLGGMQVIVDGRSVDFANTLGYRGVMFSDVPNLASCVGYTNASWTLKADLICEYVCRLLNFMDSKGLAQATPRNRDPSLELRPSMDLSSGYVQRSADRLPKQGNKSPWRMLQNYTLDMLGLRLASFDEATLEFAPRRSPPVRASDATAAASP